MEEFRELAEPLVDWLRKNYHPHATIIIGYDFAEVLEGKQVELFSNECIQFKKQG